MKPWKSPDDKYINVNGAEAAVGTRNNPAAGGLVNTIGDNTELWYSAYGRLQKIVHGKNVCTKKRDQPPRAHLHGRGLGEVRMHL